MKIGMSDKTASVQTYSSPGCHIVKPRCYVLRFVFQLANIPLVIKRIKRSSYHFYEIDVRAEPVIQSSRVIYSE